MPAERKRMIKVSDRVRDGIHAVQDRLTAARRADERLPVKLRQVPVTVDEAIAYLIDADSRGEHETARHA